MRYMSTYDSFFFGVCRGIVQNNSLLKHFSEYTNSNRKSSDDKILINESSGQFKTKYFYFIKSSLHVCFIQKKKKKTTSDGI